MTVRSATLTRLIRHHIPWSYRIDIFVLIIGCYLAVGMVVGALIVALNINAIAEIRRSAPWNAFVSTTGARSTIFTSDNKDLIINQLAQLNLDRQLGLDSQTDQYSTKLKKELGRVNEFASLASFQTTILEKLDPLNKQKLLGLAVAENFWGRTIATEIISLGTVFNDAGTAFYIIAGLSVVLMAYHISNVFYTREIRISLNHPQFSALFALLLAVGVTPVIAIAFIDHFYVDSVVGLLKAGGFFHYDNIIFDHPESGQAGFRNERLLEPYSVFEQLFRPEYRWTADGQDNPPTFAGMSLSMVVLVTFIGWVASWLWAVRQFGATVVITSSFATGLILVIYAIFSVQLTFTRFDSGEFELGNFVMLFRQKFPPWFIALFLICILIGTRLKRSPIDSYVVCVGYVGAIFSTITFLVSLISLKQANYVDFFVLLLLILAGASMTEAIARGLMFRFLYQPQP